MLFWKRKRILSKIVCIFKNMTKVHKSAHSLRITQLWILSKLYFLMAYLIVIMCLSSNNLISPSFACPTVSSEGQKQNTKSRIIFQMESRIVGLISFALNSVQIWRQQTALLQANLICQRDSFNWTE